MDIFNKKARVILTCSKRLSPYLEKEVNELGFETERVFPTGVEISATVNECIRLNLNLRCASQILYSLKTFAADSPDDIYKHVKKFPWEDLLAEDGYFTVTNQVAKPPKLGIGMARDKRNGAWADIPIIRSPHSKEPK